VQKGVSTGEGRHQRRAKNRDFVCHCGSNIAGFVNVPDVVEYAKTLPQVVYAENNLYTCIQMIHRKKLKKKSRSMA